ncbi:MAG: ABC transporter ATP-binding protein, partial [Planctomycetota bacterium]
MDFDRDTILNSLRKAVHLLTPGKRRLLFAAAAVQVSLGLLDLLGIALVGVLAAVAVSGTGISTIPAPVQSFLDRVGLGGLTITQLSAVVAVTAVVVLVAKTALSAVMQRRIFRFLANRQAEVSARLARAFLSRPLMDVQRWTEPEAIYALGSGVGAATVSLLGAAIIIASEIFLFAIVAVSLFLLDPIVTLVAIALFATLGLVMQRVLTKRTTRNAQVMTDASIDTLAAVSEALQTYREATVLNRRDLYLARYERLIGQYAGATASTAFIMEIPKYVLESALYLGILLLAGVQFVTKDFAAAASTTALFLAAGTRVTPALLRLQGAGITIRNASVQAQPTFHMADFLQIESSIEANSGPTPVPAAAAIKARIAEGHGDFDASIVVTDATVTYLDALEPALADASFTAPAGSSIALVGSTGAGKSTLADVVLGVLEPAAGTVLISGIAPREAISRWPGAIAYVPQQVALVFGSVRDNVALGLPRDAVDDDMVW